MKKWIEFLQQSIELILENYRTRASVKYNDRK